MHADLLVLPEYASAYDRHGVGAAHAQPLDGPFVTALRERAAATGVIPCRPPMRSAPHWSAGA